MEPIPSTDRPTSGVVPETFPVPSGRTVGENLDREIKAISQSAIVDGLLEAVHGLMAVLNENRQILALNDSLLQALGVPSIEKILGLRLGEAVHCIRAEHAPGGCGTSEYCPTCGAAIAQVIALAGKRSAEQLCAIEIPGNEAHNNLFFRVRASPLNIGERKYILLFLQDVSHEQRIAALEQVFLHDLRNTALGISMGSSLLAEISLGENAEVARDVLHLAERLAREIELQRCLAGSGIHNFQCRLEPHSLKALFDELQRSCRHHPALLEKNLAIAPLQPERTIATDLTILHRILYNMVINALEATPQGGTVKVSTSFTQTHLVFSVWNSTWITPDVARRIFQRNFSTKKSLGHGLGTYSMKLLGEKLLGGRITFTTSPEQGTYFTLELPA